MREMMRNWRLISGPMPTSEALLQCHYSRRFACFDREGRGRSNRPKAPHAELDVVKAYSQPLVDKLENNYFELSEKSRLAELAVEVGLALTRPDELGEILQSCSQSMVKHLDAALARIWMLNDRKVSLELEPAQPRRRSQRGSTRSKDDRAHRGGTKVLSTNTVVSELSTPEQDWARRESVAAFAGYPLIVEDRWWVLSGFSPRKELPEATIGSLATIADCVAGRDSRQMGRSDLA